MPTGLENELLNDRIVGSPSAEEETVTYNGNRDYDPGPNTGSYGFVEVEIDGEILECTNAYTSNAYGGQYCVGDTYKSPFDGGSQTISEISVHGIATAPNQWDAEETYSSVGEKLGMSLEEWTDFSAEIQALNETVLGLQGNMFGPTEQERGRLGIRISQENPDWTEAQVMAEADRLLEEKWKTSDAYREAALAETELFAKYGISKPNPAVYGTGIWQDEDGKYFRFESNSGHLWQTSQDDGFLDYAVPIAIALGAGIISGGAASALTSGLTAGLSSTAAGAINGVLGSAISQGITTGGIDPSSLLQAAILGGIGGLADGLNNYDNVNMPGGFAGDMDSAIGDLANMLGMNQTDTIALLEGIATGAVNGDDLESIALGVVGTLGQQQIMDMLRETFGETLDVDDWFKDGASHIPMEALEPIIGGVINAAIDGGMSTEDALKMAFDYFKAGGDIDFALPGVPDAFQEWLDGIPGLDFEKSDEWDIIQDEDGNYTITWTLPELGDGFDIECPEGWVSENGHCIEINIPAIECPEGWVSENGHCVEINIDIECPEGWVSENGHCVEIDIDIECPEGWVSENGHCVEVSVIECMEGWEWSDLYGKCVEKIDDDVSVIECMEGWEWSDLYGECVEKIDDDTNCPEGWVSEAGHCVEIEVPGIEPPVLPPAPQAQQGNFTPSWSGLFQTGTVDVYKAPPLRSLFKDYL